MSQENSKRNTFSPFQNLITKIAEMKHEDKIDLLNLFKKFSNEIIFVPIKFSYDEIGDKR